MTNPRFADIILPLAVRGRFTYRIPDDISGKVKPGVRVTVQFGGKNLYTGIVCSIHDKTPDIKNVKPIIEKLQATNFRISENIIVELLRNEFRYILFFSCFFSFPEVAIPLKYTFDLMGSDLSRVFLVF